MKNIHIQDKFSTTILHRCVSGSRPVDRVLLKLPALCVVSMIQVRGAADPGVRSNFYVCFTCTKKCQFLTTNYYKWKWGWILGKRVRFVCCQMMHGPVLFAVSSVISKESAHLVQLNKWILRFRVFCMYFDVRAGELFVLCEIMSFEGSRCL